MNLENDLRVSIFSMSFSIFNAIRLFFFRSLFSSTCTTQSDASLSYFCGLSLSFAPSIVCDPARREGQLEACRRNGGDACGPWGSFAAREVITSYVCQLHEGRTIGSCPGCVVDAHPSRACVVRPGMWNL